jgi:cytochrome P450
MHNPKYYKNPEKFDPERWNEKSSVVNSEPYSFIPFSAGQKSCIGKYLALMESKLIVIGFLTNFEIERTDVPLRMHAKFLY